MKYRIRLVLAAAIFTGLQFTACKSEHATHHAEHPAEIAKIEGTELSRLTLTEKAMQRLDVQTVEVREAMVKRSPSPRRVVPYSSLIYDQNGQTWVYTSPQPRTFVRQKVDIDYIEGDLAVLKEGPPTGTAVASVAVAELYGTEFKVGH